MTRTRPPSGHPPPARAETEGGQVLDLEGLADAVCRRYEAEFPDERERYGDAGPAWCRHDNQHILNWAAGATRGWVDLERELAWLARVLEARDFPLERLARNLDLASAVTGEQVPAPAGPELARRLEGGAAFVRSRPSFLSEP